MSEFDPFLAIKHSNLLCQAALANPNTTHHGRERAKAELHHMGRGSEAHVPISTKIKRALGIRSTPRTTTRRRRYAY